MIGHNQTTDNWNIYAIDKVNIYIFTSEVWTRNGDSSREGSEVLTWSAQ